MILTIATIGDTSLTDLSNGIGSKLNDLFFPPDLLINFVLLGLDRLEYAIDSIWELSIGFRFL